MPGDLRSEEFGPYPYRYEDRVNKHPDEDSMNIGTLEGWLDYGSNEQLVNVIKKIREKFIDER